MTALRLLFLLLGALLAGCGSDEPRVLVDLSLREDVVASPPVKALTYAYLPQYSHTVSYERHRRLVEYLQRTTGLAIRQVFPETFDEHIRMVEKGEIDISFSNPFVYVRLAQSGARAFARIVEPSGQPDFHSEIIVRKDNAAIRSLQDCRGKRWMAVDPSSAGGYLFALGHFHDAGLRPQDFAEIAFAGGRQEQVVLAVYTGLYDIGSIRDGTRAILHGRIDLDQLRVLAVSRPYPGWVYAARQGLPAPVVEAVRTALLALDANDPQEAEILYAAGMRGVLPASDEDFQPVRELAGKLGLELRQLGGGS